MKTRQRPHFPNTRITKLFDATAGLGVGRSGVGAGGGWLIYLNVGLFPMVGLGKVWWCFVVGGLGLLFWGFVFVMALINGMK